jgi:hypothetical protein
MAMIVYPGILVIKTIVRKPPDRVGVKLVAYRAGLPGNGDVIIGSALFPSPAKGGKAGHRADLPAR